MGTAADSPGSVAPAHVRTRSDAEAALLCLGRLQLRVQAIEADVAQAKAQAQLAFDDAVRRAQSTADDAAAPLCREIETVAKKLADWATDNRPDLLAAGRSKTVRLAAGTIAWRVLPASVDVTDEAAVVREVERLQISEFLRRKVTLNRSALLARPDLAGTVPGITITAGGDVVLITPTATGQKLQVPMPAI